MAAGVKILMLGGGGQSRRVSHSQGERKGGQMHQKRLKKEKRHASSFRNSVPTLFNCSLSDQTVGNLFEFPAKSPL